MKQVILMSLIGAAAVLSGCGGDNGEVTDTSVNETAAEQAVIVTETSAAVMTETDMTASSEDILRLT